MHVNVVGHYKMFDDRAGRGSDSLIDRQTKDIICCRIFG